MKRNCYESYDYVDPDNLYTDPGSSVLRNPKFQVEVSHPKEIHLATCSPSIF
ncbi:Uncharacterised protein [Streptococcus pneumoniae]|nr:Uncharacterised protein [Streptococcus pneumoniae]